MSKDCGNLTGQPPHLISPVLPAATLSSMNTSFPGPPVLSRYLSFGSSSLLLGVDSEGAA